MGELMMLQDMLRMDLLDARKRIEKLENRCRRQQEYCNGLRQEHARMLDKLIKNEHNNKNLIAALDKENGEMHMEILELKRRLSQYELV